MFDLNTQQNEEEEIKEEKVKQNEWECGCGIYRGNVGFVISVVEFGDGRENVRIGGWKGNKNPHFWWGRRELGNGELESCGVEC